MRAIKGTLEFVGVVVAIVAFLYIWRPKDRQIDSSDALLSEASLLEGSAEGRTTGRTDDTNAHRSDGFTLVPQAGTGKVLLLNMSNQVVKEWPFDAQRVRLLKNCNLLVLHGSKWGLSQDRWKSLSARVREYDWDGNVVFDFDAKNRAHHDVQRLDSGNTLFLRRYALSKSQSQAWGVKGTVRTDEIVEVTPSGSIAWTWNYLDHFPVQSCGVVPCQDLPWQHLDEKDYFDWTHTNTVSPLPGNHWFDQGDERFKPGNLLVIPRNWSTVLLIDKDSGKVVWFYRGDYLGGLCGGHDAHMIPTGLPGAGNILVFDNGRVVHKGMSIALEVNPLTKERVWSYQNGTDFHSHSAGSLQRLPNGNTLVSEDVPGRVFEVSREGDIVWEYRSETRTARAHRYSSDYCEKLGRLNLS